MLFGEKLRSYQMRNEFANNEWMKITIRDMHEFDGIALIALVFLKVHWRTFISDKFMVSKE